MVIKFKKNIVFVFFILAIIFVIAIYKEVVRFDFVKNDSKIDKNNIGIVNLARIRDQSLLFIQLSKLIEEENSKVHKNILSLENSLRLEYENLKKLQDRELVESKQKFDNRVFELEQYVQKEKEDITKKITKLQEIAENELEKVLNLIVAKKSIKLLINTGVLGNEVIVSADSNLNITDEVIKELNSKEIDLKKSLDAIRG